MFRTKRHAASYTVLLLLVLFAARSAPADSHIITAQHAHERVQAQTLVLVDVRSPAEWRETGVAKGAYRITIHQSVEAFQQMMLETVDNDKDRPVGVICAAGNRSNKARSFLLSIGFSRVFDVNEGMLGNGSGAGWLELGLPVEQCGDC